MRGMIPHGTIQALSAAERLAGSAERSGSLLFKTVAVVSCVSLTVLAGKELLKLLRDKDHREPSRGR